MSDLSHQQLRVLLSIAEEDLAKAIADSSDTETIQRCEQRVADIKQEMEANLKEDTSQSMALLRELFTLTEGKKKTPLKKAAKSVYHRDYLKTKDKPYRKYDPAEYQKNKREN